MNDEEFARELNNMIITYRNIRGHMCDHCYGWGVKTYPTTATYHGGIGGCAMTPDVCDKCWGSGDIDNPWPSQKV
jgi:hypothetical protein